MATAGENKVFCYTFPEVGGALECLPELAVILSGVSVAMYDQPEIQPLSDNTDFPQYKPKTNIELTVSYCKIDRCLDRSGGTKWHNQISIISIIVIIIIINQIKPFKSRMKGAIQRSKQNIYNYNFKQ